MRRRLKGKPKRGNPNRATPLNRRRKRSNRKPPNRPNRRRPKRLRPAEVAASPPVEALHESRLRHVPIAGEGEAPGTVDGLGYADAGAGEDLVSPALFTGQKQK